MDFNEEILDKMNSREYLDNLITRLITRHDKICKELEVIAEDLAYTTVGVSSFVTRLRELTKIKL